MTVLFDGLVGPDYKPAHMMVIELPRGMLMREERFRDRILAREVSYAFIREIAESTLPFQNVANLLRNVVALNEWTSDTVNLRCMCEMVIEACDKAADKSKPPCGAHNAMGRMPFAQARKAGKSCFGYDNVTDPGGDTVFVMPDPDDWDETGRGIKRYPHTYECILRPWMYRVLRKGDSLEARKEWRERTEMDGSPPVMKRRVRAAQEARGEQ